MTKKYRLSTSGARVDACSGKSGIPSNIYGYASHARRGAGIRDSRRRIIRMKPPMPSTVRTPPSRTRFITMSAVAAALRVVVEAVEQQLVDRRADVPLARFDQRQPQLLRRVLDAVEVARQPALRRRDQHAADVRELPGAFVPLVGEAGRRRDAPDRRLVAGQEVPGPGVLFASTSIRDARASSPPRSPACRADRS